MICFWNISRSTIRKEAPSLTRCTQHRLFPVTSQTDTWESTCIPISSSPWSTRRGRSQVVWWAEVALIWLRWCYPIASTPVPSACPAAWSWLPPSQPQLTGDAFPSLLLPAVPIQSKDSLLTLWPGFLQSRVLWHHMGQLWDARAAGNTAWFPEQWGCIFPPQVSALAVLMPAPITDLKYRDVHQKVRSLLTRVFVCCGKDTRGWWRCCSEAKRQLHGDLLLPGEKEYATLKSESA